MFRQGGEFFDFTIQHIVKTGRQVVAVPAVYDNAIHAVSMVFAFSPAGTVILPRRLHFLQKSVLKLAGLFGFAFFKAVHGLLFQGMVVYHPAYPAF